MREKPLEDRILDHINQTPGDHTQVSLRTVFPSYTTSAITSCLSRLYTRKVVSRRRTGKFFTYTSLASTDATIADRLRALAAEVEAMTSLSTIPASELLAELSRRTK